MISPYEFKKKLFVSKYEAYLILHRPEVRYSGECVWIFSLARFSLWSFRMLAPQSLANQLKMQSWTMTTTSSRTRRAPGSRTRAGSSYSFSLPEATGDIRGCRGWWGGRRGVVWRIAACITSALSSWLGIYFKTTALMLNTILLCCFLAQQCFCGGTFGISLTF